LDLPVLQVSVLSVPGPGIRSLAASCPVFGHQKTSWPEAQEVADERDVAFAVR